MFEGCCQESVFLSTSAKNWLVQEKKQKILMGIEMKLIEDETWQIKFYYLFFQLVVCKVDWKKKCAEKKVKRHGRLNNSWEILCNVLYFNVQKNAIRNDFLCNNWIVLGSAWHSWFVAALFFINCYNINVFKASNRSPWHNIAWLLVDFSLWIISFYLLFFLPKTPKKTK